jgi:hypothetical protein
MIVGGCVISPLPPSAAKFYIGTAVDSLILRSKINESTAVPNDYLARSAEKSPLPPSAAEYYFEADVFSMILQIKIMEKTSASNFNLARSAMKTLFTQSHRSKSKLKVMLKS